LFWKFLERPAFFLGRVLEAPWFPICCFRWILGEDLIILLIELDIESPFAIKDGLISESSPNLLCLIELFMPLTPPKIREE
jgi:hypothetical protein